MEPILTSAEKLSILPKSLNEKQIKRAIENFRKSSSPFVTHFAQDKYFVYSLYDDYLKFLGPKGIIDGQSDFNLWCLCESVFKFLLKEEEEE